MSSFTIPTIYTAVDRFSVPLRNMERANRSFGNSLGNVSARSERMFRKLTPGLGEVQKQFLSFASTAAAVGAVISGVGFSTKAIMDYEKAVASFKTIVSDLTDNEFSKFKVAINDVAKETKKSSIDTALAFEKIAGLNADFAKTSEGLSEVAKAAITLSKASGDELGASAESLVGIMNQFSLGTDQANRAINVLAAGQAVGAASIGQTSEAFVNFGSVASGANITLEQSVGLVETLGKFSLFGAEAGTKLRGSVLKLQQAGVGYKTGQFQINDALEESKKKVDALKTAKEKDAAILKLFGAENISTGKILLNNIDTFKKYTDGVTATSEAQKAADINSNTLSNRLDELKNAWVNMLTGSSAAGSGLEKLKNIIKLVTDNLDTIVSVGLNVIKFMLLWKIANIAMRGILIANNIVLGINIALQKGSMFSLRGNALAIGAYSVATAVATGNMAAFNAVLLANPIGVVIIGLGLLALAMYGVSKAVDEFDKPYNEAFNRREALRQEAFSVLDLRDKYLSLGKTLKEAEGLAVASEQRKILKDVLINKMKLASVDPDERQQAVQQINSLGEYSKNLNGVFNRDMGQKFANTKELKTLVPEMKSLNTDQATPVDWLKPILNPKEAQATANANANKGEVKGEIIVKTVDSTGALTSTTSMPIVPVLKSTY